ncbi:MAG TPA: chaperone NapD [Thermodesulfovibrionales bacterium]|jgi:nitrate reductase NapAB chaperone NapD|nr:chaperone NapD [Thermodesulfovibrionales bacterium]
MTGIIVEVEEKYRDNLSKTLAGIPHITIHSQTGNHIGLVVDTDDIHVLTETAKELQGMKGVVGIHPVFSQESFPF